MEVNIMLIQITKNTEPLFSAIDNKMTKAESKAFAEQNPLFTWTGKYINQNRKKVLCLINNQTLAVVIITDVNATKKKKLAELIKTGISASFELCAIPYDQIQDYLETDPTIAYGPTSNRRVTGILNEVTQMMPGYGIDLSKEFPLRLMLTFNNGTITTSQAAATDETNKAFDQPLQFTPISEIKSVASAHDNANDNGTTDHAIIERTWQPYKEIAQFKKTNEAVFQDQLEANNNTILNAFATYLEKVRELSPKSVRKHQSRAKMFIQEYLNYYRLTTPIDQSDDFDTIVHFLSAYILDKGIASSKADFNSYKTAFKHFYPFLNVVGEISDKDLKMAKEAITLGGDDSFYELANMGGSFWF